MSASASLESARRRVEGYDMKLVGWRYEKLGVGVTRCTVEFRDRDGGLDEFVNILLPHSLLPHSFHSSRIGSAPLLGLSCLRIDFARCSRASDLACAPARLPGCDHHPARLCGCGH